MHDFEAYRAAWRIETTVRVLRAAAGSMCCIGAFVLAVAYLL